MSQVVFRWNIQRGVIVIPKTTHKNRMIENIDVWDFELSQDEMKAISTLDMGYGESRTKHFDPEFVRMVLGVKIHD